MKRFDTLAYICLYSVLVIGAAIVYKLRFDSMYQFLVILLLCAFYLIWGFAFHNLKKDATSRLYLEYLIISAIAVFAAYLVFVS